MTKKQLIDRLNALNNTTQHVSNDAFVNVLTNERDLRDRVAYNIVDVVIDDDDVFIMIEKNS